MLKITFCGHSFIEDELNVKNKILQIIQQISNNEPVEFYIGEYGRFDILARLSAIEYKKVYPKSKIIFISPYNNSNYIQKKDLLNKGFDLIEIMPKFVPPKFAIIKRNQYMVDKTDIIITYINKTWGGAYQTYNYAKRKNKVIINISND